MNLAGLRVTRAKYRSSFKRSQSCPNTQHTMTVNAIHPDFSPTFANSEGMTSLGALYVRGLSQTLHILPWWRRGDHQWAYRVILLYSFVGLLICVVGAFVKRTAGDGTWERNTGDVTIPDSDKFSVFHNVPKSKLGDAESLQREIGCPFEISVLGNEIRRIKRWFQEGISPF